MGDIAEVCVSNRQSRTELFVLNRAYLWSAIGLLCLILSVGEALGQQELWDKHMQVAKEAYAKSKCGMLQVKIKKKGPAWVSGARKNREETSQFR